MRHLFWSRTDPRTVCGCARWVEFPDEPRRELHAAVHYSHARRSDCTRCRTMVRAAVTKARLDRGGEADRREPLPAPEPAGRVVRLRATFPPVPPRDGPDERAALYWALRRAALDLTRRGEPLHYLEGEVRRAFWDTRPAPTLPAVPAEE